MCVACAEFIKGTLTLKEFNSALWEITREDSEEHLVEIEGAMRATSNDPEKLKQRLKERAATK